MVVPRAARGLKSDKLWRAALLRALKRRAGGKGSPQWLDRVARRVVSEADDGNMVAAKECGDRLDGKSVQGVELGVAVTITAIERRIVDPLPRVEVVELKTIEHASEDRENG